VLSAKCSDFNLDRGVWRKPSHQTKRKRTEHVPLSGAAIKLLQDLTTGRNDLDAWLFPGRIEGQPLKEMLKEIKRFWASLTKMAGIEGYRLHDKRHTFASHLVSSGFSLESPTRKCIGCAFSTVITPDV
jgi:integrase